MWNNANLLSVEPSETNLNEIWIKIQTAHSRIHFKMTTMLSRAQRVKACLRNWGKSSRISYSNILYILLRYRMCPSLKTISISPVTHIYMRPIHIHMRPYTPGGDFGEPQANMMTPSNGNIFRVTGHVRWIPRTKASDAGLWCFLWSASE